MLKTTIRPNCSKAWSTKQNAYAYNSLTLIDLNPPVIACMLELAEADLFCTVWTLTFCWLISDAGRRHSGHANKSTENERSRLAVESLFNYGCRVSGESMLVFSAVVVRCSSASDMTPPHLVTSELWSY